MSAPAPVPSPDPERTSATASSDRAARREVDHDILRLAIPSLGALIAEPLFVLVDSAFVARVSTEALAGLGLAATILTTVVGLAIFLAYSTTAAVARAVGAGRMREALARGTDACWLALGLGTACAVVLLVAGPWLLGLFGPTPAVLREALVYLRIGALGLPAMLAVQAATGLVRGLQDARLPLIVAVSGALVNIPLNAMLILGLGWGIAGSAVGTVIVQWGMALTLLAVVARGARRYGVSLRPQPGEVQAVGREAVPMFVRTLSLRAVLIVATLVATRFGPAQLAAHQLAFSVFTLLSLALDALAIAGQALTGRHLGASRPDIVHAVTRRLMLWGIGGGVVTGVVLLVASYIAPQLFSPDPAVQENLRAALWVLMVAQPVAGYVFVLDGVLMGAGDAPYLARAGVVVAVLTILPALGVAAWTPAGPMGVAALWLAIMLWFLVLRALALGWRVRGDAWMRLGAE
ncbi:MATE family efflux transporter [Brachybacterium sp. EF45031]|uniref:MATE family efflux transporter n=1 Tax=Brachybacterium sillae TaxID=2810536 RepID=UPI00217E71FF|nr:MATE family efflux transporter [Brachybacterium sillae]MCS6711602.1 MATE family efflux transporter [Brachybacterium sillae]